MFTINGYKKIGICLITISLIALGSFKVYNYIDFKRHEFIIDNIFKEGYVNEFDYIGYIEIDELGIKREIVRGITDDNLNKNVVALNNNAESLSDDDIVLAGHSTTNVFGKLHQIKKDTTIKIISFYETIEYTVVDTKIVNKDDIDSLKGDLCLITCMNNPNKRLIVYANKKVSI